MSGRKTPDDIEGRLEDVRRSLRERHARIEPDEFFIGRVVARLPRNETWAFDWAVRRILPVSLALALVLTVAVLTTGGPASRTTASASASASASGSTTSQTGSDPLEWLLEGRQELR